MDAKFTSRSQEALSAAIKDAVNRGNNQVEPSHLVSALLEQNDSIAGALVTALGADPAEIAREAAALSAALPSLSGSTVSQPQLSRQGMQLINNAERCLLYTSPSPRDS